MIDGFTLTLAGILQGGAVTVLVYVFFMFMTGRIVTQKTHDDRVNDAKEQTAIWRAAHETSQKERREVESLIREGLESQRMVLHLVRSIRNVATGEDAPSVEEKQGS